ncbi:MAG: tetratricopeptide repeat protein [Chloroflexi bacterium]|nr:tetratricopeptide repeat protein [Chloroflexota bacterium]MBI3931178.1 tetratricopeptide repeat protein [Chloroflexota bacterium]
MSYQEEERARQRRQASKQAVALAMQGRWQEAVAANKSLLGSFPNDVDAFNRLARAYMELGDYARAREAYEKTIKIDPYNTIAQKNLNRLSHLGETGVSSGGGFHKVEPQQFIEEVGKAGVVKLCHLAPPEVLARTVAGGQVILRVDESNLIVENSRGEYLGQVEAKHGQRLIKLMEGGNKYTATIISLTEEVITVMIREVYRHPSQDGRLSFPLKVVENSQPYTGDRIIRRELEYEEALLGAPSYIIIGDEETELLPEESSDIDEEIDNEE